MSDKLPQPYYNRADDIYEFQPQDFTQWERAVETSRWIPVRERQPDRKEPIVYARPDPGRHGKWHVGIAYWTVSQRWNPQMESEHAPEGFTHWKPLGDTP